MNFAARPAACALTAFLLLSGASAQALAEESSQVAAELLWSRRYAPESVPSGTKPQLIPAIDDGHLFLATGDRVLAIALATGLSAWPNGRDDDDGAIFWAAGAQKQSGKVTQKSGAAVVSEGRLIAVTGLGGPSVQTPATSDDFPELSAFDVRTGEGKLLWSIGTDHALARQGWMPDGPPIVVAGRVWFPVRMRQKPSETALANVTLVDGNDLRLMPRPMNRAAGAASRAQSLSIEPVGQSIVCADSTGNITAISHAGGAVQWSRAGAAEADEKASKNGFARLVSNGQRIFVALTSGSVFCVNSQTGNTEWAVEVGENALHLDKASSDTLIVAGRNLSAFDSERGTSRWRIGFPDAPGAGRPAAFGRRVAWTTREELFLFDLATGAVLDRLPLMSRYGVEGGDIYAAGANLVLLSGDRISVFRDSAR